MHFLNICNHRQLQPTAVNSSKLYGHVAVRWFKKLRNSSLCGWSSARWPMMSLTSSGGISIGSCFSISLSFELKSPWSVFAASLVATSFKLKWHLHICTNTICCVHYINDLTYVGSVTSQIDVFFRFQCVQYAIYNSCTWCGLNTAASWHS